MKGEGSTELHEAGDFDGGATWIAYPEERMRRASHALVDGEDVWLVDPVDAANLDDWLADRGSVAGVVLLLDRHTRDAAEIAARHDVTVHLPEALSSVADELDAPTTPFDGRLGGTGYRTRTVLDLPVWREAALYHPDRRTLVVPEAVGTADFFRAGGERLGVHPALRLFPPRDALAGLEPERVLVGHGDPLLEDGAPALADALAGSRRRSPRLYAGTVRELLPV